jgi:hypothetical protein
VALEVEAEAAETGHRTGRKAGREAARDGIVEVVTRGEMDRPGFAGGCLV